MKVLYLILLCILGIAAQRRFVKPVVSELETSSPRPTNRGRGKTRFSFTPEFEKVSSEYEAVTKNNRNRDAFRRNYDSASKTETRTQKSEIKEDLRRSKQPRIITESRFEANNVPKKELFIPVHTSTEEPQIELLSLFTFSPKDSNSLSSHLASISTEKPTEANLIEPSSSGETTKVNNEIKRKKLDVLPLPTKSPESQNILQKSRTRRPTTQKTEEVTPSLRVRGRAQSQYKHEESVSQTPNPHANVRFSKRRAEAITESTRTRGPSVFSAENPHELPSRTRTGRKVGLASERGSEQLSEQNKISANHDHHNGRIETARRRTTSRSGADSEVLNRLKSRNELRKRLNPIQKVDTKTTSEVDQVSESQENTLTEVKLDVNHNEPDESAKQLNTIPVQNNEPDQVTRKVTRTYSTRSKSTFANRKRDELNQPDENIRKATPQRNLPDVSKRRNNNYRSKYSRTTTHAPHKYNPLATRRSLTKSTEPPPGTKRVTVKRVESGTSRIDRLFRSRTRPKSFLTLNHQQLEVLPLFERESKTVSHSENGVTLSPDKIKSPNSAEDISLLSSKQTETKLEISPLIDKPPTSTQANIIVTRLQSISVETKTEKAFRKLNKKLVQGTTGKPLTSTSIPLKSKQVEESVSVSEVSEIRTERIDGDPTPSEENISESDNYPPAFKAVLRARKTNKDVLASRSNGATTTVDDTKVEIVTPIPNLPIQNVLQALQANKPNIATTKPPRPRFSLTTKRSVSEILAETTINPLQKHIPLNIKLTTAKINEEDTATSTPLQKFHARYKSLATTRSNGNHRHTTSKPAHKNGIYAPKPPKGIFSSRKYLRSSTVVPESSSASEVPKNHNVNDDSISTKVPLIGLGLKNRFSSKYRSDILSKSGTHRTSTGSSIYIPTVPTVTPSLSLVHFPSEEGCTEYHWFNNRIY